MGDRNTDGGSQSDLIFWSLFLRPHNQRELTATYHIAFNFNPNQYRINCGDSEGDNVSRIYQTQPTSK